MVKATETNFAAVLEGRKQYQVPLYQRTYSWGGTKQLNQLWDDVVELAATRRTEPGTSHFIGSLVLATSPDFNAVGMSKLLVVDGQQRLTTLTLLLAALRDHLTETGDAEGAEGIHAQYLANVYDKGKPAKVLPTQADREAYKAVLTRSPDAGGPPDRIASRTTTSGPRSRQRTTPPTTPPTTSRRSSTPSSTGWPSSS